MSTPGELFDALGREARARLGGGSAGSEGKSRTYRGRSLEGLIPRIQQELGPDAVILRRREGLTGGVLGFFQHQFVEVEAMAGSPRVDVYDDTQPAAPPPSPAVPPPTAPAPAPQIPDPATAPLGSRASWPIQAAPAREAGPPSAPGVVESGSGAYLTGRLAAFAPIAGAPTASGPPPAYPVAREPAPPRQGAGEGFLAPLDFQELLPRRLPLPASPAGESGDPAGEQERRTVAPGSHARARTGVERSLRRLGVSEELAAELIDRALAHTLPLAPRAGLAQAVRLTLAQRIPVAPPLPTDRATIVLVGGGGAGKTTLCASLLGAYRKSSVLSASYASFLRPVDGGELQVLLSPRILVPAEASSARAQRAIRAAREQGLALFDTPSVSLSGRGEIRELGRLLAHMQPERVVVALPATLGAVAAGQLLRALVPLRANALAITHADETDQIGVAVEAACAFGLAPEYLLERGRPGWRLRRVEPTELAGRLLP